jgi:hypothetical protein
MFANAAWFLVHLTFTNDGRAPLLRVSLSIVWLGSYTP